MYHNHKGGAKLEAAMREVHKNIPSTVKRAKVSGKRKEAMLRAIAFSKARKAGAKMPIVHGSKKSLAQFKKFSK